MFDFFEFSNELLCVADRQGYLTRVNPAWTRTLGWSSPELTARPYYEFVHPDDVAATQRETDSLLRGNHETINFENRCRARDGSYRWLSWHARVVDDGRHLMASARDITANKQQAEALHDAQERFRVLQMHAPVCIFHDDAQGRCTFINQHWTKLTGLSREESLGFGWMKAIHPEDLPRAMQKWHACREAQADYQDEYRLIRTDGQIRSVIAAVQATHAAPGNDVAYIGTLLDITERKAAEDKLRLNESQMTGILNNTPAVIYLKDREGRYLLANFAQQAPFVHLANSVIGNTDLEIFPAETAHAFRQSDACVWEARTTLAFQENVTHADGRLHTYRSYKFPVLNESGDMIALGGVSADITDLQEAHEALEQQQQLLRSLIEVQEAEKQFLCHEFHDGLIQYVVGSLMTLEGLPRRHLQADEARQVEATIANLRKGVEDGRRVIRGIRPAVLDDSGLAAAIEDLVGQFSGSGILVTSKCDPQIGRLPESIQTTAYRVAQEAMNNARKHSGTDVVRIDVQKLDGHLCLEVRDFGCGFDVVPARKRGFGLVGMTERVRLLGGQCTIDSQHNTGTCVSVRLPIES